MVSSTTSPEMFLKRIKEGDITHFNYTDELNFAFLPLLGSSKYAVVGETEILLCADQSPKIYIATLNAVKYVQQKIGADSELSPNKTSLVDKVYGLMGMSRPSTLDSVKSELSEVYERGLIDLEETVSHYMGNVVHLSDSQGTIESLNTELALQKQAYESDSSFHIGSFVRGLFQKPKARANDYRKMYFQEENLGLLFETYASATKSHLSELEVLRENYHLQNECEKSKLLCEKMSGVIALYPKLSEHFSKQASFHRDNASCLFNQGFSQRTDYVKRNAMRTSFKEAFNLFDED